MTIIGTRDIAHLPSIWAEARSTGTDHNEQTNIVQTITRAETDAMAHNTVGPIRRTTYEAPIVPWRDTHRPRPNNEQSPVQAQQQHIAEAQSKSSFHPNDYLSRNYNIAGRNAYTPDPNPVVINRMV